MEMHAFGRLLPASTARRRLLAAVRPIDRIERCDVADAFDRIAAQPLRAPRPIPDFARAAWDGYAVRSVDTAPARRGAPVELRVVAELYAEERRPVSIRPHQAAAIATGAPLPRGSDAVAIFEDVERSGDRIRIERSVRPGTRVVPVGGDLARGAVLARRAERLGAADVGAIASAGFASVRVYARPIVEVVPNGNELIPPGGRRGPGRIFESNNAALAGAIRASGGIPRLGPPLPDDAAAIESALRSALRRADLVLATGGSSVGERDHLPRILPRLGRMLFHGVAVRPGKPTLAAVAGRKLVLGLPGHPTSCLANMFWLVDPAIRRLARRPGPGWSVETTVAAADLPAPPPGMTAVVPLALVGGRAFPTFRGSAAISSLRPANGFAFQTPGRAAVARGERLRVCRLDPPLGGPSNG